MEKIKVGYVPQAKTSFVMELAEKYRSEALALLNGFDNVEVVDTRLITLDAEVPEVIRLFKEKQIDLLIMHYCTFSLGAITPAFAVNFDVPIILLSTPEADFEGNRLRSNSFCAMNMNGHTLYKMKKKYRTIVKPLDDATLKTDLGVIFASVQTLKNLKNKRVGLVGSRSPGFYTSNFDELKLRNLLGVEVDHIDISKVYAGIEKVSEKETLTRSEEFLKSINYRTNVEEKHLHKMIRLNTSLENLWKEFRLDAFAIKCWPEFHGDFATAPCAALGKMNSKIPTAAEGDVYGVVTMMMQQYISGSLSFFSDYIYTDLEKNTGIFWHCGCASMDLAGDKSKIVLDNFAGIPKGAPEKGCAMNFQIFKPNKRITVNRIGTDSDGNFRILNISGKNVKTDLELRGTYTQIEFDNPAEYVRRGILDNGFEHHYAVVLEEISAVVKDMAYWKDINFISF